MYTKDENIYQVHFKILNIIFTDHFLCVESTPKYSKLIITRHKESTYWNVLTNAGSAYSFAAGDSAGGTLPRRGGEGEGGKRNGTGKRPVA